MSDARTPLASRLNYAQCWEDTRILCDALQPSGDAVVLSIASAGDNTLALALAGAQVHAVDVSAPQLALCALKVAGGRLDYADFRGLLGLTSSDPLRHYRAIRQELPEDAARFWDDNQALLAQGVLGQGRFERYLALFAERILPLIHRRSVVERWFELETVQQRRDYWRRWDNMRWRALFRLFFSQRVMAARGRSPEQFAHVRGPIGERLMQRARRALTELDPRDNGYAQWIMTGRYHSAAAEPLYLSPQGHAGLTDAAERIRWVHNDLGSHMTAQKADTYTGFNLSDVPEYLNRDATRTLLAEVARTGRTGARVAYWNLFVPRCRPAELAHRLERRTDLALALYAQDRSFVYGAFMVEQVR